MGNKVDFSDSRQSASECQYILELLPALAKELLQSGRGFPCAAAMAPDWTKLPLHYR